MLYNNNYGNGFSYPAPNNGVNYNNWEMNRQTSPGLNNLSNYVPNNQSARVYLKALPVTSLEEAKAAIVDLDGSMYVFVNVSQGEIYTKQYNLANGTSDFLTYKLYQPTNVQPEEYFKKYDDTLRKLVNDVEKLKGEMGNVRPITNAGSANGGSNKKQS